MKFPRPTRPFSYDPVTFLVRRILTVRASDNATLQDLNYTYDPIGNITQIRDAAQQTIYFNNQIVSPQNDFIYDAIYRIVSATGREHIGQNAPVSEFDANRTNLAHPADGNAMQRYLQQYDYDGVGNMLAMVHSSGSGPFINQWTRHFTPSVINNQLSSSQVGARLESYSYDVHGNMTAIPGMPTLNWDFNNQFRSVDLGGGGTAYYSYDAAGNRTRKIIERQNGALEQRLYLGALEIYTEAQGGALKFERETLHLMDGTGRLAMIDSRTVGDDGTPAQLIRYQFGNHLGTALLELDDAAKIISYEEYYPYGSTSFQSVDASREVPARRYRYTGKERDEESGLYYHGARYYAPWLGRWTAADPSIWTNNKLNAFLYALASPLTFFDPDGKDEQTAATGVTFRFDFSPSPTITKPQAGIVWLGSGQPPDVARGLPNFGIGGSSSTASSTGSGGQTGWLAAGGLAAGGLPPGLQPPGPFSFPSSPGSPVQVPGFGPEFL